MIDINDIQRRNQKLCLLAKEKFSVKADTPGKAMRKIGRRVPAHIHKQAAILEEVTQYAGHPKLLMTVDAGKVDKAYSMIETHLNGIDPRDRRNGAVLGMLGALSFNLIVVFVIFITVLVWRGFI